MSTSTLFSKSDIKRSLILAGGGVRLAYHAGVLKALEEANEYFDHVDGTSGGIFNTAALASGNTVNQIITNWQKIKPRWFISLMPIFSYFKFGRLAAMGDADGIRQKIFPTLGISLEKIQRNKYFRASFNVCNFSKKTIENIDGEHITEDHLIAGMSLPIFMPALQIGNDWYTDAVWIKDANIQAAVENGAEQLVVVYCIGNSKQYFGGAFNQYVHMIEMSAAGGMLAEFDWLKQVNKSIERGFSSYGQKKTVSVKIIKPKFPLPLDPALMANHINFAELINMGYAHAKSQLLENQEAKLDYTDLLMHEPGVSLQFRAKFKNISCQVNHIDQIELLFDLRQTSDNQIYIDFCGGLIINSQYISTYQNKAVKQSKILQLEACFQHDNQTKSLKISIPLGTIGQFYMGLELKNAMVSVGIEKAVWYNQKIGHRVSAQLFSKVYDNASWWQKQRHKYKLLRFLYSI